MVHRVLADKGASGNGVITAHLDFEVAASPCFSLLLLLRALLSLVQRSVMPRQERSVMAPSPLGSSSACLACSACSACVA